MKTLGLALFLVLANALVGEAQVTAALSGVPGDGIPDLYYLPSGSGAFVQTSMGTVPLASQTLLLDTDGTDMIGFFAGGPNLIPNCHLCDGMNLPGVDALAGASFWTVRYASNSTQWLRTNPLAGPGFRGVMGFGYVDGNGVDQAWPADVPPFLDFPESGQGLATATGFCPLVPTFSDDTGRTWEFSLATSSGELFLSNIYCAPEPNGLKVLVSMVPLLPILRRREG